MKRLALMLAALLAPAATPRHADAALIIDFFQDGANVLAYGQGTLNLASLTATGGINATSQVQGATATAIIGSTSGAPVDFYSGSVNGPISFGTDVTTYFASSGTGLTFGILGTPGLIVVPRGYTSGTFLAAGDVFAGQTFASLGLNQGSYLYSFGSGANADTITVNVGAVPEPASLAMLAVGLVGARAWRCSRRLAA